MTQYIEVSGALYEAAPDDSVHGCEGCAFEHDMDGCGLANSKVDCTPFIWLAQGRLKDHSARSCGACAHGFKAMNEDPCNKCVGDPDVPKGYKPMFTPSQVPKAPGPVTRQLQARENLPEIPDGPGWTDHNGSNLPCGYHQHVAVQFRDGGGGGGLAGDLDWGHKGSATDIVRWRAEEPARNGRPPVVVSDPKDFGPGKVMVLHSDLAVDLNAKPTNPKDLIGVRKVPMSTVPAGVLMDVALALHEGAVKYGRHNYRGVGVRASVYYDAGIGHLMDWWEGDDIDTESGLSHVTKAIASLVVLRDAMLQGKLTDDRPPRSKVFKRDFNRQAGEIIDRHADKSPRHWTIADSEIPSTTQGLS